MKMTLEQCRAWIGNRVAYITRGPLQFGSITRVAEDGYVFVLFDGRESEPQPLLADDLVRLAGRRTR